MLRKITISDIENSLCDLDTEYREALAHCLMNRKYLSDSPLRLEMGTEKQQAELERVWNKPLTAKQIKEIINDISKEMSGDFQYGSFNGIKNYYMRVANEMIKGKER